MGKVVRCEPWGTHGTDIHFLCAFGAALLVKEYYPPTSSTSTSTSPLPSLDQGSNSIGDRQEQDFLDAFFFPVPYKRVVCLSALIMLARAAANSSQPRAAILHPVPALRSFSMIYSMLVCPSGFFFFFSLIGSPSLQRTGLPVSHSLPLICFSVWQSKHCPSDTSACLRLSFHLWRWEWNAIWQEVGFTVCYLPVAQSPPPPSYWSQLFDLSIWADPFCSISDQRGRVKLWSEKK